MNVPHLYVVQRELGRFVEKLFTCLETSLLQQWSLFVLEKISKMHNESNLVDLDTMALPHYKMLASNCITESLTE